VNDAKAVQGARKAAQSYGVALDREHVGLCERGARHL
jgi:hypothetical protein